ncbi:MAG: 2-C-methyl-D-erythritol 2,4-cyclodiphosphate synthase [Candidatus Omnitrophica bacterium]|nr:2-C-methyl-D-erythritol 2,4-cyclodiphosphate synthase [Candidatus Omnitrophota bacterium]
MRTGIGYDIHKLVTGRKLVLGGVEIPFKKGLEGHSDADVLLHAICDAMLGAAGLNDIGTYFPDTDTRYKDIESVKLLKKVSELVTGKRLAVNNIDTIIIAGEPRLLAFVPLIRKNVAGILEISESALSIKAKTAQGIGPAGKGEAIEAFSVVTLKER